MNSSTKSVAAPPEVRPLESEPAPYRRPRLVSRNIGVRLPAIATALMGVLNLWSAITPGLPDRMGLLWDWLPFDASRGSHLSAVLLGFALLALAQGLWRRKTASWALTLGALMFSALAHLLKGLDYEEAIAAIVLAWWLFAMRRQFHARSDVPTMRHGLHVLGLSFTFTLVYGTLGFYMLDAMFRVHFSMREALVQTVQMFVSFSDPHLPSYHGYGSPFAESIYLAAATSFVYTLVCLLRPLAARHAATEAERRAVQPIVEAYGRTAVAFCALLPDKLYWHSPGGSVVPYAVVGRVAVSMGDPIGPIADTPDAIHGFCEFCRANDWRPAFYEIYDEFLEAHRDAGLRPLRIAHEAVVNLTDWSLAGGENKGMRSTVNGARNRGLSSLLHEPPLTDALLQRLRVVSDEWLSEMSGSEKGFSLGWFDEEMLRANPVMVINDADGDIVAFANIVSCYTAPESTIDLMRRIKDTPKGTMELLFVSLFEWAKAQGFERFNLGLSPFAMVGEHSDDPVVEKAIHFMYEHMDQYYNFKGLHAFKEKFHPDWRPMYLTYEGRAGLPVVSAAIVRADSSETTWWAFLKNLRGDKA